MVSTVAHDSHQHDAKLHDHQHRFPFGESAELIFALVCGFLLVSGWLLGFASGVAGWVQLACYGSAYFFGGFYASMDAWESLKVPRFNIDFLMIVAAIGSAMLGSWGEGALLLFLFSLGHALEHFAMGRAKRAIEALAELTPDTAVVRRDNQELELSVAELVLGDLVIVKPNQRIAADGFVVTGTSSVNQASITGESIPVDKRPVEDFRIATERPQRLAAEHRVFAGTINENGALEIAVTQLAENSTLARVVKLVQAANSQKSPTQKFADQFERYFVPAVLTFVVLLLFAPFVLSEGFGASFRRAMAVLIGASPCALAISTPSAVLSGVARAARGGVLVKGGDPLENLGRLKAIAFDKTGTLTEGKPRVTDVIPYANSTDQELLRNVIAVEKQSDHPLAAAVVRDGTTRLSAVDANPLIATEVQSVTGRGVRATIENETVLVGKPEMFAEIGGSEMPPALQDIVNQLKSNGRTTMIVRRGERYLGALGMMDTPRESAAATIARLKQLGITRMMMISGDNQQVADAVARSIGIDEAHGDLMPDDKVALIKKLRETGEVAMVGDGVNDAPALANATVGIAMGAAGSAVALETADVALMADDLSRVTFAIGLGRQTGRIIRQNLWISLGMVAILVPASLFGLQIGYAVVFHEGSTIAVVFNALRLLVYRDNGSTTS